MIGYCKPCCCFILLRTIKKHDLIVPFPIPLFSSLIQLSSIAWIILDGWSWSSRYQWPFWGISSMLGQIQLDLRLLKTSHDFGWNWGTHPKHTPITAGPLFISLPPVSSPPPGCFCIPWVREWGPAEARPWCVRVRFTITMLGYPKVTRPTDPKKSQKCIHDIQECFELLALLKVNSLIYKTLIGYPVYYEIWST